MFNDSGRAHSAHSGSVRVRDARMQGAQIGEYLAARSIAHRRAVLCCRRATLAERSVRRSVLRPVHHGSYGGCHGSTRRCVRCGWFLRRCLRTTRPDDHHARRAPTADPRLLALVARAGLWALSPGYGFKPRCEHPRGRPSNDRSPLEDASAGRVNRNRPVELQRRRPTVDGTHDEFRRFRRGLRVLHRVADPRN